jgi:rhodanese-related sulfurtransferase
MHELSPVALREFLETTDPRPLLLDVREAWEFEICHLEDSVLVPMRQLPALVPQLDCMQDVVVICHHGIRSRLAGQYLEQNGFERVFNLTGGVAGWARDVDPTLPTY